MAPKTRQRRQLKSAPTAKSATSTAGGRVKKKAEAGAGEGGGMFFRGIALPTEAPGETDEEIKAGGKGITVYLDPEILTASPLRTAGYVNVAIVRPPGLAPPQDPQQGQPLPEQDAANPDLLPATRVIAKLMPWENAPDMKHIALSQVLANALDIPNRVGAMIRIEPACPQLSKNINVKIKIHPFAKAASGDSTVVKWGSKHKTLDKEEGVRRLIQVLGKRERKRDLAVITAPGVSGSGSNIGISPPEQPSPGEGLLEGPITDGLVLPNILDCPLWAGGLVKLEMSPTPPDQSKDSNPNEHIHWFLPMERKYTLELSTETNRPPPAQTLKYEQHLLTPPPAPSTPVIGVDGIIDTILTNIMASSSVLLAGPHLSGKSSILNLVANRLRKGPYYYQVISPGSMSKFAEERVAVIKDEFTRWFMMARFAASLSTGGETGGYGGAVVILDDLERVCKAESADPGAVSDSGRARQIAEVVVGVMRRYCTDGTGLAGGNVVVLGACNGKENVHAWMVGGRGFREVVNLKSPDRDGRRRILEGVVSALYGNKKSVEPTAGPSSTTSTELMKRGGIAAAPPDSTLDLLEIANQTDGYTPGDLVLLIGRARHEAVVRVVDECADDFSTLPATSFELELTRKDFTNALTGFVPVGLRGVKLQASTVNWKDIGGLRETRQTLLETLEWPTKYAPIFANCPLRLRSGLLLYGYPGCGKTLLASAVAGECGLNFISVKGPEILNKYIGASEKSVRDLFERASSAKPCVLFFDEFDSIAPKRGHDSTGVTDRVVNQMLTQMDGAEGLEGVYVLAATSRPDLIDPALLRPGRLDKSLLCDLPDFHDRVDILRALSSDKLELDATLSIEDIANRTEGYSGADLQAVLYNAHLEAIHDVIGEEERRVEAAEGRGVDSTLSRDKSLDIGSSGSGSGGGSGVGGSSGAASGGGEDAMGDHEFFQFVFGDSKNKLQIAPNGQPVRPLSSSQPYELQLQHQSQPQQPVAESRSKRLAERAAMLAKLDLLRKRARAASGDVSIPGKEGKMGSTKSTGAGGAGGGDGANSGSDAPDHEAVVIKWEHIERSLATTRGSISPEERRRLKGIYKEFVGSRNGEMKSGEGSTEIGGRSSLM